MEAWGLFPDLSFNLQFDPKYQLLIKLTTSAAALYALQIIINSPIFNEYIVLSQVSQELSDNSETFVFLTLQNSGRNIYGEFRL